MKFFKFEAEGDQVFVKGETELEARAGFEEHIGAVPESMLTVTEITEADLPEGEFWL